MLRRALAGIFAFACGAACVDLFHATDFETLCDRDAAACGGDAAIEEDAAPLPPIDFCTELTSTAEARQRAVKACALLGACSGALGESAFGPCVIRTQAAFDCALNPHLRPRGAELERWSCLARATTCEDIDRCVLGAVPKCAPLGAGSFTQCSGLARIECAAPGDGRPRGADLCALRGQTCQRAGDSISFCVGSGGANCALQDAGSCVGGTSARDCASVAGSNIDRGRDCADIGAGSCAEQNGVAACAPDRDAPACDGGIAVTCTDDDAGSASATSCVGGRLVTMHCSALSTRCDVSERVSPSDPVMACADRTSGKRCTGPDLCADGKITSCANGITFTVDCKALRLGGCHKITDDLAACDGPVQP